MDPPSSAAGRIAGRAWSLSVAWPGLLAVAFALFLVPGLLGAAALAGRRLVPAPAIALAAVALSSVLGYALFWAYVADATVGKALSCALLVATVAAAAVPAAPQRMLRRTVASPTVAIPLLLLLLVAVFYNGLLFAHGWATPVEERAQMHLRGGGLPVDNVLPAIFAQRLYDGDDPRELYGDWKSSDRPPLQTGIVLAQMPAASVLGGAGLHYQLLGSALQCSWVPAVWALCAGRLRRRATALSLATATFSGFFFLNSVFVWPKLLAAALVVLAYVLVTGEERSPAVVVLACGAAALALLAHAGALFTLIPLAVLVAAGRTRPPARAWLAGAVAAAVLLGPWQAYARFHDPPGDRLAKWHLAGVVPVDDRSLVEALGDSYAEVGLAGALHNKVRNLVPLFGERPRWALLAGEDAEPLRTQEFFGVAWALGALNVSWFLLAAWPLRRRTPGPDPGIRPSLRMLALGGASIVTWVLLMFGPATTVVHQGSYAAMVFLWVGLSGVAAGRSGRWAAAIVAVQVVFFTVAWARDLPGPDVAMHAGNAVIAAAAAAAVIATLVSVDRLRSGAEAEAPPEPVAGRQATASLVT